MRGLVEENKTVYREILKSVDRVPQIGPPDFKLVDCLRTAKPEMGLRRILMPRMTRRAEYLSDLRGFPARHRDPRPDA